MAVFGTKKYDESPEAKAHRVTLIDELTFELVPLKSLDAAVQALPAGAEVSVTCSPTVPLGALCCARSTLWPLRPLPNNNNNN